MLIYQQGCFTNKVALPTRLLYQQGNFMQVPEGEDKDVHALYEKIHPTST
jgi:Sensors of blue-light using FAD